MSIGTSVAEGDWSAPATRGELVRADLRVGLKDVQVGMLRIVWTAVATLGAVGILLQFF